MAHPLLDAIEMARFVRSCKPMLKGLMAFLSLTFAPCPDEAPQIGVAEAHIWQVDLEGPHKNYLSASEQERAHAMRHPEKQAHYVAARSALRLILSKYTQLAPQDHDISFGPYGKPQINGSDLHFNVTHAQGKALIGVARVPVGIDLEFPRAVTQLDRLIADYFSAEEARELMALHDEEKAKAFLAAWTRKEACLKATGEGIAGGLHRYRVTLHDEAKLVSIDGNTEASSKWTLHAFSAFGDGQAAICAAHPTLNVQGFTL